MADLGDLATIYSAIAAPWALPFGFVADIASEGAQKGVDGERAYQKALRAGWRGSREQFAHTFAESAAAYNGALRALGDTPQRAGEAVGLASADPYTDAALGAIRLLAVVGVVVGGIYVLLRVTGK